MITSEVATARRKGVASHSVSTGTITKPPPTPKKPVITPTSRPAIDPVQRRVRAAAVLVVLARPRARWRPAAISITGTNASTSAAAPTLRLANVPSSEPAAAGAANLKRQVPAHAAVAGERAGPDRRRHRDHHQRRRRGRADGLTEHVDQDGKGKDRASPTDRADDEPDREPQHDRERGHARDRIPRSGQLEARRRDERCPRRRGRDRAQDAGVARAGRARRASRAARAR